MKTRSILCVCMELECMTMECMGRQALACFVGTILARLNYSIRAISILLTPSKILGYEHWNYLKEHAYQF